MKLNQLFTGLILFFLFSCSNPQKATDITIACASNLQFAMKEIIDRFEDAQNVTCELIIGSSGKLTAQIQEGAPYDIFVSADLKYPISLYKNGISSSPPKIYAYGKLILWSNKITENLSIGLLKSDQIRYVAIANPETAPYGKAAMEVLTFYQQWDHLKDKLVYGESISQTNQFILSQSADAGFTAKSIVLSAAMKGKGKWVEIDPKSYSPIKQGILLIDRGEPENETARAFYNFIFSPEAREILLNYGYSINE